MPTATFLERELNFGEEAAMVGDGGRGVEGKPDSAMVETLGGWGCRGNGVGLFFNAEQEARARYSVASIGRSAATGRTAGRRINERLERWSKWRVDVRRRGETSGGKMQK